MESKDLPLLVGRLVVIQVMGYLVNCKEIIVPIIVMMPSVAIGNMFRNGEEIVKVFLSATKIGYS